MKVYVVARESSHSYVECGSFHVGLRRPVKGKIEILLRSTGVDLLINTNPLTDSLPHKNRPECDSPYFRCWLLGTETEKKVSESCCCGTLYVAAVALGRVLRAVAFVSGRKLLMNKFSSPLAVAWHIRVLFFVGCCWWVDTG